MRPGAYPAGNIYASHSRYLYQEEMVEGQDIRERARELEEYLHRDGRYAEFRESAGSSNIVTPIVGLVFVPFSKIERRTGGKS